MAGPKPKHRDTPLSATPETGNRQNYGKEPVRSLSLSRANQLERRTADQIEADGDKVIGRITSNIDKKYPNQGSPHTFTKDADKKMAINAKRDMEYQKAANYGSRVQGAAESKRTVEYNDAYNKKSRMADEESNVKDVMSKYKIPTKKKR
jgi:hypothetical protein